MRFRGPSSSTTQLQSKIQLQTELNNPRISRTGDPPQARVAQLFARRIPVGVIHRVEKLRAELRLQLLVKIEVFPRRQIDPDRSRPGNHRAPRRAVPERVLLDQAGCIEESIDRLLA